MMAWPILPPRWFARPRLALAAGATAILLLGAESDRRVARAADHAGAVLVAQATSPDPPSRDQAGAAALTAAREAPGVTAARLVPPEDLLGWLRRAGVETVPDRSSLPITIEIRLAPAADRAGIAARLRAIPGIAVADAGGRPNAPGRPRWLFEELASATLLALAAATEMRSLRTTMAVLRQLGATPGQRAAALLPGVAASAGTGAVAGGILATLGHGAGWPGLLWAVPAVTILAVAALLPALFPAPRP